MPERLFHYRKRILVSARFDLNEAIGSDPRTGKARRKKIGACHDPEDIGCRGARRYAGREQARSGVVSHAGCLTGEFVQRCRCKPTSRQPLVQGSDRKRQMRGLRPKHRRDGLNFGDEGLQPFRFGSDRHGKNGDSFVRYMFSSSFLGVNRFGSSDGKVCDQRIS